MMSDPPALPGQRHPTVVHMLLATAGRAPDALALSVHEDGGRVLALDYAGYWSAVAALARRLAAAGAGPGERVAVLLPNGADICIATYGILAAGAQCMPLNPGYTAHELQGILADGAPHLLLVAPERLAELAPLAAALGIGHVWPVAAGALAAPAGEAVLPGPLPTAGSPAMLQFTGGTTGRPKGVELSHAATAVNVAQREAMLPTASDGERILCAMPLFHAYALAMGLHLAAGCGGHLAILPRYHPEAVLDLVAREAITLFPGAPTMFLGLMAHPRFADTDWSSVRLCYSGAAPLPAPVLQAWEAAVGAPVLEGFGQTEAGPVISYNPPGRAKPGSVGLPLAGTRVEIVDAQTGAGPLPQGQAGEIRVRGPQVMSGYRNRPEETAEALRDGWLLTGDIGRFDADGYLFITDRKKDMAVVGGYNVYPREIDEALAAHPEVAEAAAVAAPDAYRGEVVRAFVVPRAGAAPSVAALLEHCRARLTRYKLPASIDLVTELPRTTVGKTDKLNLKRLAAERYPAGPASPAGQEAHDRS